MRTDPGEALFERGMAKQRIWLLTIVVALFGLQAPLCALACAAGPTLSAAVAEPEAHCRGTSADPAPASPAPSHEDCDCEASREAWLAAETGSVAPAPIVLAWLPHPVRRPHDLRGPRVITVLPETDLPPPDRLLLASILLI